nr:MAG TPA: hypothetical protein [Caudoviricetes sp.]
MFWVFKYPLFSPCSFTTSLSLKPAKNEYFSHFSAGFSIILFHFRCK